MPSNNRKAEKLNKQSGHRAKSEGTGYFGTKHKESRQREERPTEKQERAQERRDNRTRAEKRHRPGKPQPAFLGNRTRTEPGRHGYGKRVNRMAHLFEWGDSAAGSKYISEFAGESGKTALTMICRIIFSENFTFYDDSWKFFLLKYFIMRFRLTPTEQLTSMKTRLLRILSTTAEAKKIVERFGPAFYPNGSIVDNGVTKHFHSIRIADGSLHAAQASFAASHEAIIRDLYEIDLGSQQRARSLPLGGMEKPGEKGNSKPSSKEAPPKKGQVKTNVAPPSNPGPPAPTEGKSKAQKNREKRERKKAAKAADEQKPDANVEDKGTPTKDTAATVVDGSNIETFRKTFTYRKQLNGIKTHKLSSFSEKNYIDSMNPVDCLGNPFCGYVSIDACNGTEPDFSRYKKFCLDRAITDPYDAGRADYLSVYATTYCSKNLIVFEKRVEELNEFDLASFKAAGVDGLVGDINVSEKYVVTFKTENPDESEWIAILYQSGALVDGTMSVGHFVPLIGPKTTEVMPLPAPRDVIDLPFIFSIEEKFVKEHSLIDTNGNDRRVPHLRREKIEITDTYSSVSQFQVFQFNPAFFFSLIYAMVMYMYYNRIYQKSVNIIDTYVDKIEVLYSVTLMLSYILCLLNVVSNQFNFFSRWSSGLCVIIFTFAYRRLVLLLKVYPVFFVNRFRYVIHVLEILNRLELFFSVDFHNLLKKEFDPVHFKEVEIYDFKSAMYNVTMIASVAYLTLTMFNRFFAYVNNGLPLWSYFGFKFNVRSLVVSNSIAQVIYSKLEEFPREHIDEFNWEFLNRLKFVGTNYTEQQGVVSNTRAYVWYVWNTLEKTNVVPRSIGNRGFVAVNTMSSLAYVSKSALGVIAANQLKGKMKLGGANYVKSFKLQRDPVKKDRPLAACPIGSPISDQGPLGPGLLPVTDQIGVLAAFCGRSMIYEEPEDSTIDEFIRFSTSFLRRFIDETDCSELHDEDPVTFFRSHYHGKRSQFWIDGMIKQYQAYESGFASPEYDSHSCFVKLENSAKNVDGVYHLRPRLIMTMSPVMLFKCCRILRVIDRWNHGPFSRFQVKDMEPREMIEKIMQFSDRPHTVTDYSSFESSIMGKIRIIENFVITELLDKAHMLETKRDFELYVRGPRELVSNGIKMVIDSRCSGDPHTSCGNGIINVCIAAWCLHNHHKRGELLHLELDDPFIIAEGDDGLVPSELPDREVVRRVGFKFSEDVSGMYCGDTDFLRRRWMDGKVYLNVGRSMSVFWVKTKQNLSQGKQLFLLRCMGCSLHHMSPGHPILFAIVRRIGVLTHNAQPFNNWFLHIDMYKWPNFDIDNYPTPVCDESMRAAIAEGAIGFPPISVATQISLERIFLTSKDMYIGDMLSHYDEVLCYVDSLINNRSQCEIFSDSVLQLLQIVRS